MPSMYALDDAAAAALWPIMAAPVEHIGLLYAHGDGIRTTETVSQDNAGKTRGKFAVPAGTLRGMFHNHPPRGRRRETLSDKDKDRIKFSQQDIRQAQRLGVPSYIAAGHKIRRYDPATGRTEDVLAEIPVELIRDYFHRRFFEGRDK